MAIVNIYAAHDFNEFTVACRYHGGVIKEQFASFYLYDSDLVVDLATGATDVHRRHTHNSWTNHR